jgi:hypothetical protein
MSTFRTAWLVARNDAKKGKHRTEVTEVTEVTEEGMRLERKLLYGQHGWLAGNDAKKGKHRTEVTEVTEGGMRLERKLLYGQHGWWRETTRKRESIARAGISH